MVDAKQQEMLLRDDIRLNFLNLPRQKSFDGLQWCSNQFKDGHAAVRAILTRVARIVTWSQDVHEVELLPEAMSGTMAQLQLQLC